MKLLNTKFIVALVIISLFITLISACGSQPSGLAQVETATSEPKPTVTPTDEPVATSDVEPESVRDEVDDHLFPTITIATEAGSLLQGSRQDIYFLTADGMRRRIYNWDTFLAFGLNEADILRVDDKTLDDIPLAGELTRLLRTKSGRLYWANEGQLWPVEAWETVVEQRAYTGMPVTELDQTLKRSLLPANQFTEDSLLRADNQVYHLIDQIIIPANDPLPEAALILDVPAEILGAYEQKSAIDEVINTQLNLTTFAANLRYGPGFEYEIIEIINKGDDVMTVIGQSNDGHWLYLKHHQTFGWLAADLVETTPLFRLLPRLSQVEGLPLGSPQAQPVAQTQTAATGSTSENGELKPIYCYNTPIRGFGKVWGDNLNVQHTLGCPSQSRERGTKAAVQYFEHGMMLWLENDSIYNGDPVYVFFNDGTYQRFGDLGAADPAKVGATPPGFQLVGDKFSKVYWEGTGVRVKERLGHATTLAQDSDGAFQQFRNGRMFWAGTIDQIIIIYDYYQYNDGQRTRIRTWETYEDKF